MNSSLRKVKRSAARPEPRSTRNEYSSSLICTPWMSLRAKRACGTLPCSASLSGELRSCSYRRAPNSKRCAAGTLAGDLA